MEFGDRLCKLYIFCPWYILDLLPSGSEQHEVLQVGSIQEGIVGRNTSGPSLNSANRKYTLTNGIVG